ncbi:mRNA decay protein [Blastocladiella emersonii ATCC 22665]|nr:mRNA decay protein [Blastocladiella emersonii ATCC 22665]
MSDAAADPGASAATPTPPTRGFADRADLLLAHRQANLAAANGDGPRTKPKPGAGTPALDASMKKNMVFVKKLRAVTADNAPVLLAELAKLRVDKYLAEATASLLESFSPTHHKLAPADLDAVLALACALHQRFAGAFTPAFIQAVLAALALAPLENPREERDRLARCKPLLRFATDCYLVGLMHPMDAPAGMSDLIDPEMAAFITTTSPAKSGGSGGGRKGSDPQAGADDAFLGILKKLLADRANLPLLVTLVRFYAPVLFPAPASPGDLTAGPTPAEAAAAAGLLVDPTAMVQPAFQLRLREGIEKYFARLSAALAAEHLDASKLAHKSREWYYERGTEAPEDLRARLEKAQKSVEALAAHVQALATHLTLPMPVLEDFAESTAASGAGITLHKTDRRTDGAGMWEDETERDFYENVPELEQLLPPPLLLAAKSLKQALANATAAKADEDDGDDDRDPDARIELAPAGSGDADDESADPDASVLLNALLARLPRIDTRDDADALAVEFCHYNTKTSQRRLAQALLDVRGRPDILPLYARILAVLRPLGVGDVVVHEVERAVRRFARSKRTFGGGMFGARVLWVRYLGELTKFRVARDASAVFCAKVLLENPSPGNVEAVCHLLESCGRFLAADPPSAPRMADVLERVARTKKRLTDTRLVLMLNSAVLASQPLSDDAKMATAGGLYAKERTDLDAYLLHLLAKLDRANCQTIAQQIRKFPWRTDPTVLPLVAKRLAKVKRVKFEQIEHLANTLALVNKYHPQLAILVVDAVMEDVKVGMETNHYQGNRDRLLAVAYLGHLYRARLVDPTTIFNVLQLLISFPNRDGPTEFFRIRLVAQLLDVCGTKLPAARLDTFLVMFQLYMTSKAALPMDVEFVVQDLFESLRPKLKRLTYEEALQAAEEVVVQESVAMAAIRAEQERLREMQMQKQQAAAAAAAAREEEEEFLNELDALVNPPPAAASNGAPEDEYEYEREEEPASVADMDVAADEAAAADPPGPPRDEEAEALAELDRELASLMSDLPAAASPMLSADEIRRRRTAGSSGPGALPGSTTTPRIPTAEDLVALRAGASSSSSASVAGAYIPGARQDASRGPALALVTKKANKMVARAIDVPDDSPLAKHAAAVRAREEAERVHLKNLVLSYERREREADFELRRMMAEANSRGDDAPKPTLWRANNSKRRG